MHYKWQLLIRQNELNGNELLWQCNQATIVGISYVQGARTMFHFGFSTKILLFLKFYICYNAISLCHITTNLWTWTDSIAFGACAKCCGDLTPEFEVNLQKKNLWYWLRFHLQKTRCSDWGGWHEMYALISMAWCKTAVTPLLMYRSYCSLALIHQYGYPTVVCTVSLF